MLAVAANDTLADNKKQADTLAVEGNALGRDGKFERAIHKFKQANALFQRALYDCNIGLAYVRLQQFHQAHLFFVRCKERWEKLEKRPQTPWVTQRVRETVAHLNAGNYSRASIAVTPSHAKVLLSAFETDEHPPMGREFWLPVGTHELVVTAPRHARHTQSLSITRGQLQSVTVTLAKLAPPPAPRPEPALPVPTPRRAAQTSKHKDAATTSVSTRVARKPKRPIAAIAVTASGGAALVAGGLFHALALQTKSDAEKLEDGQAFRDKRSKFRTQRNIALGLYGVGAAALGTGLYLWIRHSRKPARTSHLNISMNRNRTMVWAQWSL